jgi:hypothetical protein
VLTFQDQIDSLTEQILLLQRQNSDFRNTLALCMNHIKALELFVHKLSPSANVTADKSGLGVKSLLGAYSATVADDSRHISVDTVVPHRSESLFSARSSQATLDERPVEAEGARYRHRNSFLSTNSFTSVDENESTNSASQCADGRERANSLRDRVSKGLDKSLGGGGKVFFNLAGDLHSDADSQHDRKKTFPVFDSGFFQEEASVFDRRIDDILVAVLPQKPQLIQRAEVRSFISNEIYNAIGVQAIEIGNYRLRCFLPDEPVQLGVPVPPELDASWFQRVHDALARYCPTHEPVQSSGGVYVSNLVLISTRGLTGAIDGVGSEESGWKIQCFVGSVAIEISGLSKIDLCMVAFNEEVDQLVARDHLFKRSIILIKAWWMYEAAAAVGSSCVVSIPPAWFICTLTGFIFNRFHQRIFHPLHALLLFFSEYANFDWENYAATLNGPIFKEEFYAYASGQTDSYPESGSNVDAQSYLLKPDMLDRFQTLAKEDKIVKIGEAEVHEVASYCRTVAGTQEAELSRAVVVHPFVPRAELNCEFPLDSDSSFFVNALKQGIHLINDMVRSNIDGLIVDPQESVDHFFTGTIMRFGCRNRDITASQVKVEVPSNLTPNRMPTIPSGGSAIIGTLPGSSEVSHDSAPSLSHHNDADLSRSWFPEHSALRSLPGDDLQFEHGISGQDSFSGGLNKSARGLGDFSNGSFLPRAVPPTAIGSSQIGSASSPGGQLQQPSQISEIMLRNLALEILAAKGPLPVGEIGKMLQEVIKLPSLSSILREYFGGLKKFLEKYSDDFLISNDHPFNPNVYIRGILTPDDLAVIAKGKMPLHFEITYKKKGGNRRKANKSSSFASGLSQSSDEAILPRYYSMNQSQSSIFRPSKPLGYIPHVESFDSKSSDNNGSLSYSSGLDISRRSRESASLSRGEMPRVVPEPSLSVGLDASSLLLTTEDRLMRNDASVSGHSPPSRRSNLGVLFGLAPDAGAGSPTSMSSGAVSQAPWAAPPSFTGMSLTSSGQHSSSIFRESDSYDALKFGLGQPNPLAPVFVPQKSRFESY